MLETISANTAITDWLDGLNKELRFEDSRYYLDIYNAHVQPVHLSEAFTFLPSTKLE